jgi:long-chain acyl-CoA synthetase
MNIEFATLPDLLKQRVKEQPDHTAILFNGKTTTFSEFDALSDQAAVFLQKQGIQKGDRVGLYCINSDIFAIAYFGIVKAGGVVVPLNLLLTPPELTYILEDSGARALLYFEAFEEAVIGMKPKLPDLSFTLRIGQNPADKGSADFSVADLMAAEEALVSPHLVPEEDLVVLIYTSGTTGKPKGAMLTHKNLSANTFSIKEAMQIRPGEDILLLALPMFHAFAATVGMLFPLLHGCTIVPLSRFDPQQVLDTAAATQSTLFFGVPSMFSVLLRMPDREAEKFNSIRFAISGGAAMPVEVMKKFEEKFGKVIYEGDGPTECSPVTCVNPIGGIRKPGSVGLEVPNVNMKILDEKAKELPVGQIGEICVQGPNVMKGYWNAPVKTRESFFGDWFRTGDLGYMDEDRYFFIVDRKKDMIIVNGMNVYPRVVEEVLYKHPAIAEAAVVGEPSGLHGEVPVAYVAKKEGLETDQVELRTFCREQLGRHQIPKRFHFMDSLPKNAAGKILKRELRRAGEMERGVDLKEC